MTLKTPRCIERFYIITRSYYGFALPPSAVPAYWLGSVQPTVHGFPMTPLQVRTDDYQRQAAELRIDVKLKAKTERAMLEEANFIAQFVREAAYLQRSDWAMLPLLEGSEIDLKPDGKVSADGVLGIIVVAKNRIWVRPDGSPALGER